MSNRDTRIRKKAAELKAGASKPALSQALLDANQKYVAEQGLAPDEGRDQHDRESVHGARAPPIRLLDKSAILQITGVTFPTIWAWMRAGKFPRSRVIGGGNSSKSVWRSDEIDVWLAGLPTRRLKGDVEAA